MLSYKSLKVCSLFFITLCCSDVSIPFACLQVHLFFFLLHLVCCDSLYCICVMTYSDFNSVISLCYCLVFSVSCWNSHFVHALFSWPQQVVFMTIVLNFLSGKSLISLSLRNFSEVLVCCFVWNIFLYSFFLTLSVDFLCIR